MKNPCDLGYLISAQRKLGSESIGDFAGRTCHYVGFAMHSRVSVLLPIYKGTLNDAQVHIFLLYNYINQYSFSIIRAGLQD